MKNLLAVLGIVLLSALSATTVTAEPIAKPVECPVALPETASGQMPAPLELATLCGPQQTTPYHYTAVGSSCQMARANLEAFLTGITGCECGFCSKNFVYKECRVVSGGYQVGGYMKYSCQLCPLG